MATQSNPDDAKAISNLVDTPTETCESGYEHTYDKHGQCRVCGEWE
jgi:hypothetical protein